MSRGESKRGWPRAWGDHLVILMVVLAPWAFGSVDAWAECALALGIALLAILASLEALRRRSELSVIPIPALGLLGLFLLGLAQCSPLPESWLRQLAPHRAALRASLDPAPAEGVVGDPSSAVSPSSPTLSEDPDATLFMSARHAAAFSLVQSLFLLGGGLGFLRRLGKTLSLNAVALSLVAILQIASWNGHVLWLRGTSVSAQVVGGPFFSHSHLADVLNLGLCFVLAGVVANRATNPGFLSESGGRGKSVWSVYALGLILTALLLTHSRAGLALAILATLAVLLSCFRTQTALILVGCLTGLLLLFSLFMDSTPSLERAISILDSTNEGYSARWELWKTALKAWGEHPIWGIGLGGFATAMSRYAVRDQGNFSARCENEYLDVLTEGGLIGLACFLLVVVSVFRSGMRAWRTTRSRQERSWIVGGLLGLTLIGLHALGDFGPHIAGVAVPLLVLAASVARLDLPAPAMRDQEPDSTDPGPRVRAGRWGLLVPWWVASTLTLGLATWAMVAAVTLTRVEALVVRAGAPLPGSLFPTVEDHAGELDQLQAQRQGFQSALELRPNWWEGHARLAMINLSLYRTATLDALRNEPDTELDESWRADPSWLHGVLQARRLEGRPALDARELLRHEPIRDYLTEACRQFLEARRCCPVVAMPHAGIACLDFLIDGPDRDGSISLHRAFQLSGGDNQVVWWIARLAWNLDDRPLLLDCWRRSLRLVPNRWHDVADAAYSQLPPEAVLEIVSGDPENALKFADRLLRYPHDVGDLRKLHQAALGQLEGMRIDETALGKWMRAKAWHGLGERVRSIELLREALSLSPERSTWRITLVDWLLETGSLDQARDQARIALAISPEDPDVKASLSRVAESLAREGKPTGNLEAGAEKRSTARPP